MAQGFAKISPPVTKSDIGLGNVDNTSDLNKPISTDTQDALDLKQPLATVLTNTTASFTTTLETKLNGIEAGAEVNAVDSVNGQTGTVILDATDVGAQETLVSGTNIKTVGGTSILGSGDIPISGGGLTPLQTFSFISIRM